MNIKVLRMISTRSLLDLRIERSFKIVSYLSGERRKLESNYWCLLRNDSGNSVSAERQVPIYRPVCFPKGTSEKSLEF